MAFLKQLLGDLVQLRLPVTAAAVVATVTQLIPVLHINSTIVAGILVAVGVVAKFVETQLPK